MDLNPPRHADPERAERARGTIATPQSPAVQRTVPSSSFIVLSVDTKAKSRFFVMDIA
jgi:hypothetical protein